MTETKVGTITFQSPINQEGSWGQRNLAKRATSEMTLYLGTDATGTIKWTVDELDICKHIGLWFSISPEGKRTLSDYDGFFPLPKQAVRLMRKHGIHVPRDFE